MTWKIEEFSNRRWRTIHEGTDVEMRAQFRRLMLKQGRWRLVDENKQVVAKLSLAYAEIQIQIKGDDRNG